jgi:hypothetical protein
MDLQFDSCGNSGRKLTRQVFPSEFHKVSVFMALTSSVIFVESALDKTAQFVSAVMSGPTQS